MNSNLLNEAIAILQTMNMEDCAMEIQDLINELERVRGIAGRRLDKINALQLELAQIEDDPRRLEDSDDDEIELGREPRSHLENEIADLRASAFRSADAAQYIINYCR